MYICTHRSYERYLLERRRPHDWREKIDENLCRHRGRRRQNSPYDLKGEHKTRTKQVSFD